MPSWEKQVPAWQTQNPARTLLDRQREQRYIDRTKGARRNNRPPVIYVLPPYGYFPPYGSLSYGVSSYVAPSYVTPIMPPPSTVVTAPEVTTGFLRLEVEPRQPLQVFVDGLYIGTLADLGDDIELRLGTHRIELRAPGFRTLIFDTEIVSDRTIVYRGELEPLRSPPASASPAPAAPQAPEAASTPKPPKTPIYVIPGCYMGNVHPAGQTLRAGCDLSKLTTISP